MLQITFLYIALIYISVFIKVDSHEKWVEILLRYFQKGFPNLSALSTQFTMG